MRDAAIRMNFDPEPSNSAAVIRQQWLCNDHEPLSVCDCRRALDNRGCRPENRSSVTRRAAGDYCNVCLAFLAEARRNKSGAFMRSQVCLKSSAAPLHGKSSMELITGTSTRTVARVRNSEIVAHLPTQRKGIRQGDALSVALDPSDANPSECLPGEDIARKQPLQSWIPILKCRGSRLHCRLPQPGSPESTTVLFRTFRPDRASFLIRHRPNVPRTKNLANPPTPRAV
jgi:hypothetical protein